MHHHSHIYAGFTLIELMITLVIMAIVITIGAPALTQYVAAQRVRTTASDIVADMAFARAEAIKESRPAIMERVAGATNTWKDGWQICVDLDRSNTCAAGEVRKRSGPVPGRTTVCPIANGDFNNRIIFRPDGRVTRTVVPGANDGLKVADTMDDADATNDRVRLVVIGLTGRTSLVIQDRTVGTPCS
jgi:type IV fimbrial biogenesis protein FimT